MEELDEYLVQYGEYLDELRKRIFRCAIVFIVSFFVGLFSTNAVLKFCLGILSLKNVTIVATSPFQLLELAMSVGFFTATIITIPFLFHQAYGFLRNGLLPHERRILFTLVPLSLVLFCIGFTYGVAIMYYAIAVIAQVNVGFGIANLWDVTQFISQILITSALLGLIFEFPLVLTALIRLGLFPVAFLRRNRRIAIAAILIFVALLPPTDGLSFIVMSVPLVGLYELTIFFNSFHKRKELLEI